MKIQHSVLAVFIFILSLSGCAVNRATSQTTPGTDLSALNEYYVVKLKPDGRGINKLISNRLNELGHPSDHRSGRTSSGERRCHCDI